jgi:isopentenyl diphosphate isomerase/L-lactate dehydrogenase-like FMN-dependent dehydrogenase
MVHTTRARVKERTMAFATEVVSRLLSEEQIASRIQAVADARYFAERRVPKGIFQMFEAGSGSNVTMRENRRAFEEVLFRPRAAVFHREREIGTTVLGHEISMPAIVSSVGFLRTGHPDGETGVARAARIKLIQKRRRYTSACPA